MRAFLRKQGKFHPKFTRPDTFSSSSPPLPSSPSSPQRRSQSQGELASVTSWPLPHLHLPWSLYRVYVAMYVPQLCATSAYCVATLDWKSMLLGLCCNCVVDINLDIFFAASVYCPICWLFMLTHEFSSTCKVKCFFVDKCRLWLPNGLIKTLALSAGCVWSKCRLEIGQTHIWHQMNMKSWEIYSRWELSLITSMTNNSGKI